MLTATTFELFPTENRGFSSSLCISVGYLISGLGFGNVSSLNINLLILMLMMQLIAVIASLFIRETKIEEALLNHYHELEKDPSFSIPLVNEPPQAETIQNP